MLKHGDVSKVGLKFESSSGAVMVCHWLDMIWDSGNGDNQRTRRTYWSYIEAFHPNTMTQKLKTQPLTSTFSTPLVETIAEEIAGTALPLTS